MTEKKAIVDRLSVYSILALIFQGRDVKTVHYLHISAGPIVHILSLLLKLAGYRLVPIREAFVSGDDSRVYQDVNNSLIGALNTLRKDIFYPYTGNIPGATVYERTRIAEALARYAAHDMFFHVQLCALIADGRLGKKDEIGPVLVRKTAFSKVLEGIFAQHSIPGPVFYFSHGNEKYIPREDYYYDEALPKRNVSRLKSYLRSRACVLYSFVANLCFLFRTDKVNIKKYPICLIITNPLGSENMNSIPWITDCGDELHEKVMALYKAGFDTSAREYHSTRCGEMASYSLSPGLIPKNIYIHAAWAKFGKCFAKNVSRYKCLFAICRASDMEKYLHNMLTYLSFFMSAFESMGTKCLFSTDEDGREIEMAALALHMMGGVSLGATWSQGYFPEWSIQHNKNDVFFTWGKRFTDIRLGTGDISGYYVMTGYPGDRVFGGEFRRGRELRQEIIDKYSVSEILTFYDNIASYDLTLQPEGLVGIYNRIFEWMDKKKDRFLVVKAKKVISRKHYRKIRSRLEGFLSSGRALVIYDQASLYPALASDVLVSVCVSTPSLASLFGHNVTYYEPVETPDKYSFNMPHIKVISRSHELRNILNGEPVNARSSYKYDGAPEFITGSSIDPFVDGKAWARMRSYIETVLSELEKGGSSKESVERANKKYVSEWGGDKITFAGLDL